MKDFDFSEEALNRFALEICPNEEQTKHILRLAKIINEQGNNLEFFIYFLEDLIKKTYKKKENNHE